MEKWGEIVEEWRRLSCGVQLPWQPSGCDSGRRDVVSALQLPVARWTGARSAGTLDKASAHRQPIARPQPADGRRGQGARSGSFPVEWPRCPGRKAQQTHFKNLLFPCVLTRAYCEPGSVHSACQNSNIPWIVFLYIPVGCRRGSIQSTPQRGSTLTSCGGLPKHFWRSASQRLSMHP